MADYDNNVTVESRHLYPQLARTRSLSSVTVASVTRGHEWKWRLEAGAASSGASSLAVWVCNSGHQCKSVSSLGPFMILYSV